MSSLWEIDERLRVLEDYGVDSETGEVISDEDFYKLFDEINMDLQTKIENTIQFAKSLNAEAEAIKAEEKKLAERRKSKENLSERLKKRINDYITWQYTNENGDVDIASLNKYRFETPKCSISYRKSEVVNVFDESQIPKDYIKIKTETSVDKTAVKKAIKNGVTINGATLDTKLNMQIK